MIMIWMMLAMAFPVLGIALFFVLPWTIALPVYLCGTVLSLAMHRAMHKSMKLPLRTGGERLVGESAEVLSWRGHEGRIRCDGESWHAWARNSADLRPGDRVEVLSLEGVTLKVAPRGLARERR